MSSITKSSGRIRYAATISITVVLLASFSIKEGVPVLARYHPTPVRHVSQRPPREGDNAAPALNLIGATAIAADSGVLIQWRSSFEINNLGFNVCRVRNGEHQRVNRSIIAGSALIVGEHVPLRAGYSYSWHDPSGTSTDLYYIESVGLSGETKAYEPLRPASRSKLPEYRQSWELNDINAGSNIEGFGTFSLSEYPASLAGQQPLAPGGQLEAQWAVAAHQALKISIKKDGWYKVTQEQMVTVGFNPSVDASTLMLFAGGQEIAIRVSKGTGAFITGDYIEFYGQGVSTPETDARIYYLIAGESQGRRIAGEVKHDGGLVPTDIAPAPLRGKGRPDGLPIGWFTKSIDLIALPELKALTDRREKGALAGNPSSKPSLTDSDAEITSKPAATKKSKRRKRARGGRQSNHSLDVASVRSASFDYTVERKERLVYFTSVLNGASENFFGQVLSIGPLTETLTTRNPVTTADGPARLEVALQGVSLGDHRIDIFLNDVMVGSSSYFGRANQVQSMTVPLSLLQDGDNNIRLVPLGGPSDVSLVDYLHLTYPHSYRADNNALRFSLRSTQSARVAGFSTSDLRLIDLTDPTAPVVTRPVTEASGSGYAIVIPPATKRTKARRPLNALPESQFEVPAALSLNQPSTLNLGNNEADLLIISHKNFLQSIDPLVSLRRNQGMTVLVADIEDIYDEFSYGVHTAQAIKDFLSLAATRWTRAPRYVLLVGDASLDPHNYLGAGDWDLVPTKLVDTVYMETASDDWLTDFDNNGVAEIPVGRLPVRTIDEANLVVSKIASFLPGNVPQSALLVADAQGSYYFDFEAANDQIRALLPANMTVQTVNRRTEPSDSAARGDIISKFNQGVALVNYSGHGNVDSWTAGSIFTSTDALSLSNGNRLPFVVVMDCLNGYFNDPTLLGLAEALLKAPNGGSVASFASSGLTVPDGQHDMSKQMYQLLYGSQSVALGDAIRQAKLATTDIDVRRTWILFGDPAMKIR